MTRTLRIRWRILHWTGMPPKPQSCNGSREKANRQRPGRRAGSPVQPKTHGLPRRWRPYPAGVLPSGWSPVGLGLVCTAHGGIAPRLPGERDPCTAPSGPSNGAWATKDRMLPRQQTPLSAARLAISRLPIFLGSPGFQFFQASNFSRLPIFPLPLRTSASPFTHPLHFTPVLSLA